MGDMLSQDEINELLKSQSSSTQEETAQEETAQDETAVLTEFEIDALGEVGNISMGSAATVLHNLLNRRVTITTPVVTVTDYARLVDQYNVPYVAIHGDE